VTLWPVPSPLDPPLPIIMMFMSVFGVYFVGTCFTVQTDRLYLEAVDLGKLFKVKIRHDDSNFSSDWFLDRVEVLDPDVAEPYVFHCERWLAKKKDEGKLERSLYVKVGRVTEFEYEGFSFHTFQQLSQTN